VAQTNNNSVKCKQFTDEDLSIIKKLIEAFIIKKTIAPNGFHKHHEQCRIKKNKL